MSTDGDAGGISGVTATLDQLVWTLAYAARLDMPTALRVRQAAHRLAATADDLFLHTFATPPDEGNLDRHGCSPPAELPDLLTALAVLPDLEPIDRARHARALARVTKIVLDDECARAMTQTGLSVAELAIALGMPPSAIRTALARRRCRD